MEVEYTTLCPIVDIKLTVNCCTSPFLTVSVNYILAHIVVTFSRASRSD
jgi:hypothetical protein